MAGKVALPAPSELPWRRLAFLGERLRTQDDLRGVPSLAAELAAECDALERSISCLGEKLSSFAEAWATRSNQAGKALRRLQSDLGSLMLCHSPEGSGERSSSRMRSILGTEIPMLAKELGRIEKVRLYAETTLHLETLLGDLEDAALSLIGQNSRILLLPHGSDLSCPIGITGKQKKLLLAIKIMEDLEKSLATIAKDQLQWTHLLMAVDLRVEKTLAVLRPQALIDHRSILASIGWPPPLSTSILENGESVHVQNPLILMKEDKKEIYSQSFLALLALQVLQANRGRRRHNLLIHHKMQTSPGFTKLGNEVKLESGIWTVAELVYPIGSRVEHHFSRWSHHPEFIFALTYRITRNLLEGVDSVLQPLIDEARLTGFSAKEAWISAMVKMLAAYLEKRTFPDLSRRFDSEKSMDPEVISSWLNLINHIITIDKKMRALASSQILLTNCLTEFDGTSASQPLSILSLFCGHSEWIEIWAQIELKNAQDKLKNKLDNDEAWAIGTKQETETIYNEHANLFTFSSIEDYKAPLIADFVIRMTWSMIEKGWALPSMTLKIKFVRSTANIFLQQFYNILHQYCQEFEAVSILDNDVIHREANSINAARYCESIILEWSENVNFLEMCSAENNEEKKGKLSFDCFFANEIEIFSKLQTDYLIEIISALLVEFDCCCYDYIQNSEKWGEDLDEHKVDGVLDDQVRSISHEFIEALDMLMDRLQILKLYLNFKDFIDLWRSVTGGLDHFIFRSILLSNVRFSDGGIHQFRTDMLALFLVFKPFCIRPEAFFPRISDSLKLFAMSLEDVKHLKVALKSQERDQGCLSLYGLFHISVDEAEKILGNRK